MDSTGTKLETLIIYEVIQKEERKLKKRLLCRRKVRSERCVKRCGEIVPKKENMKCQVCTLASLFVNVLNSLNTLSLIHDIIYLYFIKLFDKIHHQKLFSRIKTREIQGKVLRWSKEWFSDRMQKG